MFSIEQLTQLSNFLIKDFKTVFATKEEMNEKFTEMRNDFSTLQKSVDRFVGIGNTNEQEIGALGNRVDDLDEWAKKVAPQTGIEYKT